MEFLNKAMTLEEYAKFLPPMKELVQVYRVPPEVVLQVLCLSILQSPVIGHTEAICSGLFKQDNVHLNPSRLRACSMPYW